MIPKIGDGATVCFFSDRRAGTIINVSKSGKKVDVQLDKATLINRDELEFSPGGFCCHVEGIQKYAYEPDPDGVIWRFSLRKNGKYVRSGDSINGTRLILGIRAEHYDFNF